jgi:hypothetical protein
LKSGLASGTVADVRVTLHQVLEQAVIHELIASNPVDRVAAPKVVRGTRRALVSDAARHLVGAASDDRLGAVVALLFVQDLAALGPSVGTNRDEPTLVRHGCDEGANTRRGSLSGVRAPRLCARCASDCRCRTTAAGGEAGSSELRPKSKPPSEM